MLIKSKYILIFLLVLIPASCLAHQSGSINLDDVISHVRYLASDELEGRKAGTEGAQIAARYIASEFMKMGLKPIGDNGSYFQDFTFITGKKLGSENSLAIAYGGNSHVLSIKSDYLPLSFSNSGEFVGDLVFAGYGISAPELNYDDYYGIDVRDKVVLVLRYIPDQYDSDSPFYKYAPLRDKTINARKKGAKGIIFTTPLSEDEGSDLGGIRFDSSFVDSGIQALILERSEVEELLRTAGKDMRTLEQALSNRQNVSFIIPDIEISLSTDLILERGYSSNVIGFLEGSDPDLKDEVIVVGAHYDHIGLGNSDSRGIISEGKGTIHNGADDNASGVAGLLELAEYFSKNKEKIRRGLLFIAFSAEELGLIGSSHYIKNPKITLDKTVAMLNMDMIGRLNNKELTVFGVGSSPDWKSLIEVANSDIGLTIKFTETGIGYSDQTVFYNKNIPVLHFFTGIHSDYHTPNDDWHKINSEGEVKVLSVMSRLIMDLNRAPKKISFTEVKEDKGGPSRFNVYLGTIPDYSSEVEGVRLMGVRGGSPAEKAGLRDGDIIVELGSESIKNIYDYVYALGEAKPGVPTEIKVIRDKKNISLEVVPEPRIRKE